jgi:hypothetical protein
MQQSLKPNETFEINTKSSLENELVKTWFIVIQAENGDFELVTWEWHYEKDYHRQYTRREISRYPATFRNRQMMGENIARLIKLATDPMNDLQASVPNDET